MRGSSHAKIKTTEKIVYIFINLFYADAQIIIRIDPLSPKSDQHQFSPNRANIDRLSSREKV